MFEVSLTHGHIGFCHKIPKKCSMKVVLLYLKCKLVDADDWNKEICTSHANVSNLYCSLL